MSETETETEERPPQMSGYDLERVLRGVAQLVERVPALLDCQLQEVAKGGIEDATARIARTLEAVKVFEETIDAKGNEICALCDKLWEDTKAVVNRTHKRIEELPALPKLEFPYALTDIVDVAIRFDGLTDQQWDRVVELAKVLRKSTPEA